MFLNEKLLFLVGLNWLMEKTVILQEKKEHYDNKDLTFGSVLFKKRKTEGLLWSFTNETFFFLKLSIFNFLNILTFILIFHIFSFPPRTSLPARYKQDELHCDWKSFNWLLGDFWLCDIICLSSVDFVRNKPRSRDSWSKCYIIYKSSIFLVIAQTQI